MVLSEQTRTKLKDCRKNQNQTITKCFSKFETKPNPNPTQTEPNSKELEPVATLVNTNVNETQIKDNCSGDYFNSQSIFGINSSEDKKQKIRRIYEKKIKKSNENVTKTVKTSDRKTNRKLVRKKLLDNKSNDDRKSCAKLNAMFGHINDSIDSNEFEKLYSLQCENWFKRETRLCETQNNWFL
jgi:hypothetical protein